MIYSVCAENVAKPQPTNQPSQKRICEGRARPGLCCKFGNMPKTVLQ